jgi:hypothetical protein
VTREGRFGAVLVGVTLTLGLLGFFIGHAGAPTDQEVADARAKATRSAEKSSEKRAYAASRQRGVRDGTREGREKGTRKGTSDGKKKTEEATQQQTPDTGTQTGTQPDYSTAPQNVPPTPKADTPEGKQLLQSDQCKDAPPPPPGYDGPVQC